MSITRGLVIDNPWIGHILAGRKDWEMRSQATAHRGWFGLIRKGSGQVVGLARLVDCGASLSQSEMLASHDHHRIPTDMILRGEVAKWIIPWKLADIIPLEKPVSYEHRSGAVTWVVFTSEVSKKLERIVDELTSEVQPSPPTRRIDQVETRFGSQVVASHATVPLASTATPVLPLPELPRRVVGRSMLTGGNIRNNHINLSTFLKEFPSDVIGGANSGRVAPKQLLIDWGGPQHVMTDIDGTKSIFRGRGWVRRFLAASLAKEGDVVVIAETEPYRYVVWLERRNS
ncbi:hypothetical protein [Paracoccus sp. (in: a-proteobacteria)]|uniref:hypothetical protein n=1 Tax=Paracoccus sp. TaxID=267 RepID=UPI00289AA6D3|nr:hypothetical protein [Paracoccus sp. (in: a-proteobacteria)]